jgi:hypothetical protein
MGFASKTKLPYFKGRDNRHWLSNNTKEHVAKYIHRLLSQPGTGLSKLMHMARTVVCWRPVARKYQRVIMVWTL